MDDIKSYIQKTRKNTGKNIKEKPIPKYIIVRYLRKMLKRTLKVARKKPQNTKDTRMTDNFM